MFDVLIGVYAHVSAQGAVVSLNATSGLSESYELQEGDDYTAEEYRAVEGEQEERDGEEYRADEEEGMDSTTGGNEDEVLELQIDEPLDDEFQVSLFVLFSFLSLDPSLDTP